MAALAKMALVGIVSALVAYLFDPERGKGRRTRAIDQAKARMKRAQEAAERRMEYEANRIQGVKHDLMSEDSSKPLDDAELRQKIKSEIIGPSQLSADVLVEGGKVTLSGELDESQYRDLEKQILRMPGAWSVEMRNSTSTSGESA